MSAPISGPSDISKRTLTPAPSDRPQRNFLTTQALAEAALTLLQILLMNFALEVGELMTLSQIPIVMIPALVQMALNSTTCKHDNKFRFVSLWCMPVLAVLCVLLLT